MAKNWFVTGASRGFGRAFATAALRRGDNVTATARDASPLAAVAAESPQRFLPLELDVTRASDAAGAVQAAHQRFGRLDVVVNNAGYGHFGAFEELTEDELVAQLDTNVLGPFRVVQAALPILRAQGSGHVVQVSSIGGVGAFAGLSAYHASKWALEAMSESLAAEVAGFGIRVTIVEPGGFATDWAGASARRSERLEVYAAMWDAVAARRGAAAPGDPEAAAQALLEVVDAPEPPLRVLFGSAAPGLVRSVYERRLAEWAAWEDTARRAQGDAAPAKEAG
ncbi:short-subunit dehydrogenase [Motilibacter peucedani]|uniref:Short-subunit dehydrogenase n=1 Tax=Motilibacter peucedani TaxID=598650 RepID=A0A420XQF1_9ACTN|nr:SDR family NAD(P)-dependent oxidoreductase [Motilibacter peucedani]RKS75531.1 short-subunit dehydrogenase [Motilibacter peucedani]